MTYEWSRLSARRDTRDAEAARVDDAACRTSLFGVIGAHSAAARSDRVAKWSYGEISLQFL
jgi:hypothetical protein